MAHPDWTVVWHPVLELQEFVVQLNPSLQFFAGPVQLPLLSQVALLGWIHWSLGVHELPCAFGFGLQPVEFLLTSQYSQLSFGFESPSL